MTTSDKDHGPLAPAPQGVPQTPRLRRSRTHLHQSRPRPVALYPGRFRHIAVLLLLGQTPISSGLNASASFQISIESCPHLPGIINELLLRQHFDRRHHECPYFMILKFNRQQRRK